jgi:hypothetical protein
LQEDGIRHVIVPAWSAVLPAGGFASDRRAIRRLALPDR